MNWGLIPDLTVDANTTAYTVSGLAPSTFHYFRVYAVDATGSTSDFTNIVKTRTKK